MAQVVASEMDIGLAGGSGKDNIGESRVSLAVVVPEYVGRRRVPGCADYCAECRIAERDHPWARGLGFGQPDLATLD